MPMYLITCPECNHQTRLRFVRKGANATCVKCEHQYKIGNKLVPVESDEPAPVADEPTFELLRDKLKPKTDPESPAATEPEPQAFAAPPSPPPAAAIAAAAAATPRDPAAVKARLAQRRKSIKKGPNVMLVGGIVVAIGLIAVIVGLVMLGGGDPTDPPPVVVTPPDGPDTPDPPDPPDTPDPPDPRNPPDPPAMPTLALHEPPINESTWNEIDPPRSPISSRQPDGAIWNASLIPGSGGRLTLLAQYIADSDAVYRSGNVRVQLLDKDDKAIAEFSGVVPIICAAQGIQFTAPVPDQWKEQAASVVSRFEPVDLLPGAVPLDVVDTAARLIEAQPGGWRAQLTVRNPYTYAVSDPTVVVDLFDTGGVVIGTWRGSLRARLAPGESFVFQTVLPVPTAVEPERITLRSYAQRQP